MRVQPSAVVAEYLATATADASRPPRCVIICGPTDNISAYYAEEFNFRWLVRAARAETQAAERVSENPEVALVSIDPRRGSAEADCLGGLACFPYGYPADARSCR